MAGKRADGSPGQVLVLALGLLALGAVILLPALKLVQTSLLGAAVRAAHIGDLYAADAGTEHALWRLAHEPGFADSFTEGNPSVDYSVAVGARSVGVNARLVISPTPVPQPTPTPSQGGYIGVATITDPSLVRPGVPVTVTYHLRVQNLGTSTVHLTEVGDLLPAGFQYVPGSSSGWSASDPAVTWIGGRQRLVWAFSPPLPGVEAGQTREQVFLASATPLEGDYYDQAWVVAAPDSIGIVSGSSAPLLVYPPVYDIAAASGSISIRSRVTLDQAGINIRSWQVQ